MRFEPIKIQYGDQVLTARQISRIEDVNINTIYKWRRAGDLSPGWVAAFKRERELHAMARARGIPLHTAWKRIHYWGWDVERAYTEPLHTIHEPKRWRKPG
jgi:hypothetical protein